MNPFLLAVEKAEAQDPARSLERIASALETIVEVLKGTETQSGLVQNLGYTLGDAFHNLAHKLS